MKLTALELRNRSFGTRFKGYDPSEVEEFLEAAAARVEQLTRENLRLTEQLGESRARAEELRARENQVNDVLVTVRKASDDAAAVTQREGAAYLHEARLEGERLIVEARERRLRLAAEVETLRLLKERLHAEVQAVVDVQQSLLDGMLSATDEDNVTIRVEAPRPAAPAGAIERTVAPRQEPPEPPVAAAPPIGFDDLPDATVEQIDVADLDVSELDALPLDLEGATRNGSASNGVHGAP